MKPKRGRPPKAPGDKRDVRIEVRGTADEVATIEAGARAAGKPVSVFVCEAAVAKARRALRDRGQPGDRPGDLGDQ